jgi:transcriptional regulator with XRE-family HTH domain
MARFVREFFLWQKRFGEYLGVGESTVAGWMKAEAFPDYAKRAALAAYYVSKYSRRLRDAERDGERPKVVRDGERYLIVRLRTDEAGVSIGEILARDIASEKAALVFAGSLRAWDLLGEAAEHLDDEIESRDGCASEHLVDLREKIRAERARVFAHEKLLERERLVKELRTAPLDLDIDLSGDAAEGAEPDADADRP